MIREFTPNDIPAISAIWEKHHRDSFGIPSIKDSYARFVYESNGKLIGFGMAKLIPEAVMVLDLDANIREKALALDNLILAGRLTASRYGDHLHAFVQDEKFATLLKDRYGFKSIIGEALVVVA